jgi:hypothetical protein
MTRSTLYAKIVVCAIAVLMAVIAPVTGRSQGRTAAPVPLQNQVADMDFTPVVNEEVLNVPEISSSVKGDAARMVLRNADPVAARPAVVAVSAEQIAGIPGQGSVSGYETVTSMSGGGLADLGSKRTVSNSGSSYDTKRFVAIGGGWFDYDWSPGSVTGGRSSASTSVVLPVYLPAAGSGSGSSVPVANSGGAQMITYSNSAAGTNPGSSGIAINTATGGTGGKSSTGGKDGNFKPAPVPTPAALILASFGLAAVQWLRTKGSLK